ncbi:MAG: AsnC family transcriptional regulator [Nitrosarchaeum sp.]|nr:AsnC family transcriptional regulator [Nitrosarchaeum sp.]PHY10008.1 MAG: AsnC family transcriptional regulator [Nitrosarchaeum sp.]
MSKAYVLIANESGTEDSIISNLNKIESVNEAHGTFGSYDILTKLESYDEGKIHHDISNGIRKIQKIRSTLTLWVNEKQSFDKVNKIEKEVLEKYMVQAFVMIRCNRSYEESILQELKKITELVEADSLIGSFEIICKIVAPTYNDISDIISKKIRKIQNIKSTITLNVVGNQGFNK